MKFSHSIKFPLGKKFEMREFSMEMDDAEFPELEGLSVTDRARFMQGMMLQMGLVFQAASGYLVPDSPEFKESWRLAAELKGYHKALAKPKKLEVV
jgi:hypothetical protein